MCLGLGKSYFSDIWNRMIFLILADKKPIDVQILRVL
mgnify:CR=1 FL=1